MLKPKLCLLFLLFFSVLLFSTKNSSAQRYDKMFKLATKEAHLEFKMPKGFTELDSITIVNCGDTKQPAGALIYSLVNKDSSIVIAFNNIMAVNTTEYKPLENVLLRRKYIADTVNSTSVIYAKEYSLKKQNADISGEYTRSCPNPFMEKYSKNRIVFIAKADYGEGSIVYYYNDGVKNIDKIIKETSDILRFKRSRQIEKEFLKKSSN